jgi:hypothetical protein
MAQIKVKRVQGEQRTLPRREPIHVTLSSYGTLKQQNQPVTGRLGLILYESMANQFYSVENASSVIKTYESFNNWCVWH